MLSMSAPLYPVAGEAGGHGVCGQARLVLFGHHPDHEADLGIIGRHKQRQVNLGPAPAVSSQSAAGRAG